MTSVAGGYSIASLQSGLLLTTASTTDGAAVTQETDAESAAAPVRKIG